MSTYYSSESLGCQGRNSRLLQTGVTTAPIAHARIAYWGPDFLDSDGPYYAHVWWRLAHWNESRR